MNAALEWKRECSPSLANRIAAIKTVLEYSFHLEVPISSHVRVMLMAQGRARLIFVKYLAISKWKVV